MSEEKKPRVYVIDDNATDLAMSKLLLKKIGCEPTLFSIQTKAMEMIVLERPDLVLLDFEMPGLGGIEVLKRLRRRTALRSMPIIMLTSRSGIEDVKAAVAAGANDYIVKPIDHEIFKTKLEKALQGYFERKSNEEESIGGREIPFSQPIALQMEAKVVSLGERSMTVVTDDKLHEGLIFHARADFMKEMGLASILVQVISSEYREHAFVSSCEIFISSSETEKVRAFCANRGKAKE